MALNHRSAGLHRSVHAWQPPSLLPPRSALARLYSPDGSQPRYPVAFLTNGGGVTERVKAHQLSEWLGVHVDESQASGRATFASVYSGLQDVL